MFLQLRRLYENEDQATKYKKQLINFRYLDPAEVQVSHVLDFCGQRGHKKCKL